MSTLKVQKFKEDAHRKMLEEGILQIKEMLEAILDLLGAEPTPSKPGEKPKSYKEDKSVGDGLPPVITPKTLEASKPKGGSHAKGKTSRRSK